jgi:hypothetical protein
MYSTLAVVVAFFRTKLAITEPLDGSTLRQSDFFQFTYAHDRGKALHNLPK